MKTSIASSIAFGTLLACALCARADITSANWVDDEHFHYRVTHMPDLDQKRDDLPCDGVIHCVPTCASNLVAYAANHGFPTITPGPAYWEGDTNYVLGTTVIGFMGLLMETSCDSGGTNGANANAGLADWLVGSDYFIINDHLSVFNGTPTFTSIGQSLCAGRIGSISYGRYDVTGYLFNTPIVDRNGGHCVTAVKVRRNGSTRELWVHDPASDEDDLGLPANLDSQSTFINNIWDVQDISVIVVNDDGSFLKTMTAINYTVGDKVIRLIDGHRTLTPNFGYSWDSSLGAVVYLPPVGLLNPTANPPSTHNSPTGTAILSMDWLDWRQELIVVCGPSEVGPATLHAMNLLTGDSQPIATPGPPQLTCIGRNHELFVYNGAQLTFLNYPQSGNGPVLTLPHAAHAMVYDDANDDVVLFSRTDRKLIRIDASLMGGLNIINVPTFIPLGTQVEIAIHPLDGGIWLWSNASNTLFRLVPDGAGGTTATPLNHPALTAVQGFDFNDLAHLLVSNAGTIVELMQGTAGWTVVGDSIWAGLPAKAQLHIARSRSNFRKGTHDTPEWEKAIDPIDLPVNPIAADCPADIAPALDTDGIVDVDDLLAVINAWGKCESQVSCVADIAPSEGDDVVDVDDLLLIINSWGVCD
jgi:hypothetical protein